MKLDGVLYAREDGLVKGVVIWGHFGVGVRILLLYVHIQPPIRRLVYEALSYFCIRP